MVAKHLHDGLKRVGRSEVDRRREEAGSRIIVSFLRRVEWSGDVVPLEEL